jgi:alanine dehydrogenase
VIIKEDAVMRVGVPREIKVHEYRVGLTPGAVREYVAAGHSVVVETTAGAGIGASDDVYGKAGAVIADSAAEVFATANGASCAKARPSSPICIWRRIRSRPGA